MDWSPITWMELSFWVVWLNMHPYRKYVRKHVIFVNRNYIFFVAKRDEI